MALKLGVESLPKFFVLDWNEFFAFLAFPAIGFPFGHPLGHAFANVNAIGEELDTAGAFKFRQPLDDGFELHLVVGCLNHRAGFFNLFARGKMAQDESPTAGAGIATAASVGEQVDFDGGGFLVVGH